jgi:hypothetical protein
MGETWAHCCLRVYRIQCVALVYYLQILLHFVFQLSYFCMVVHIQ